VQPCGRQRRERIEQAGPNEQQREPGNRDRRAVGSVVGTRAAAKWSDGRIRSGASRITRSMFSITAVSAVVALSA